jgi:hypothetical protein
MTKSGETEMAKKQDYRPTESQYKGGAAEMYVTYDLEQATRGGGSAVYPKVKRVYIAGDVKHWKAGNVKKRSGREVHGVLIEYEQSRKGYHRKAYTAERGETTYQVSPASVGSATQKFAKVVDLPERAKNVHFYARSNDLPQKYQHALQSVR